MLLVRSNESAPRCACVWAIHQYIRMKIKSDFRYEPIYCIALVYIRTSQNLWNGVQHKKVVLKEFKWMLSLIVISDVFLGKHYFGFFLMCSQSFATESPVGLRSCVCRDGFALFDVKMINTWIILHVILLFFPYLWFELSHFQSEAAAGAAAVVGGTLICRQGKKRRWSFR